MDLSARLYHRLDTKYANVNAGLIWATAGTDAAHGNLSARQGVTIVRECSHHPNGGDRMSAQNLKRYGQLIGLKPEAYDEYVKYHAAVWPGVLKTIYNCNIRNYSIFFHNNMLFAYFEYIGDDFAADMAKMAADPVTQEWWTIMNPMQQPIATRQDGEWWANMQEVFHVD